MELNNTSVVILGLLRISGEKTGYELKALIDSSTQYFWPASYGRIYPELKRLAEGGLVSSRDEPRGSRPRTVYALTETGEEALSEWLATPGELVFELRDEGVLRLFLGEATDRENTLATIRTMRAEHAAKAARLRDLQPFVDEAFADDFAALGIEGGIEFHEWYVGWLTRLEEKVSSKRS